MNGPTLGIGANFLLSGNIQVNPAGTSLIGLDEHGEPVHDGVSRHVKRLDDLRTGLSNLMERHEDLWGALPSEFHFGISEIKSKVDQRMVKIIRANRQRKYLQLAGQIKSVNIMLKFAMERNRSVELVNKIFGELKVCLQVAELFDIPLPVDLQETMHRAIHYGSRSPAPSLSEN